MSGVHKILIYKVGIYFIIADRMRTTFLAYTRDINYMTAVPSLQCTKRYKQNNDNNRLPTTI